MFQGALWSDSLTLVAGSDSDFVSLRSLSSWTMTSLRTRSSIVFAFVAAPDAALTGNEFCAACCQHCYVHAQRTTHRIVAQSITTQKGVHQTLLAHQQGEKKVHIKRTTEYRVFRGRMKTRQTLTVRSA